MFYALFGLMVNLLTFNSHMLRIVLVLWEVGAILGNGYTIRGNNYAAVLQGGEMSVGVHTRNLISGIMF